MLKLCEVPVSVKLILFNEGEDTVVASGNEGVTLFWTHDATETVTGPELGAGVEDSCAGGGNRFKGS